MASEATRLAAQSHLQAAASACTRIFQHTVRQAGAVAHLLDQGDPEPPVRAWVASAALHEMMQGLKVYLFEAHVAARMLQEETHAAAATAKQSVLTLPDALAHDRWMRLNWVRQTDMREGHAILTGLHQVRKALNREAGHVRPLHSGAQVALRTLRLIASADASSASGLHFETALRVQVFEPGTTIVLAEKDFEAIGLTLWVLVQRVWRAFPFKPTSC